MQTTIKVLTVRQPWAWAMFLSQNPKDVENRSWSTTYRGPLLIHAGKAYERWAEAYLEQHFGVQPQPKDALQFGGIVGMVELVSCVRNSGSLWAMSDCWHWILRTPRALPFHPMRGQQGLFRVEYDLAV